MTILFALLCILTGLTLILGGFRLARVLIALWGFLTGLSFGGAIIVQFSSTPLFGSILGILAGTLLGITLALLAYLYYAAAVIIATGMLGYWLGSGFVQLFGFDPGFLSVTSGLVLGVLAGFLALTSNAPKYVLIVLTSLAGAAASVSGVLLLFGVVPLDYFSFDAAKVTIANSFFWTLATLALAVAGMVWQTRATGNYSFIKWAAGDDTDHLTPNIHSLSTPH